MKHISVIVMMILLSSSVLWAQGDPISSSEMKKNSLTSTEKTADSIKVQTRIPFSKEKVVEVQLMPDLVREEANMEIKKGEEPNTWEAKVFGNISAVEGMLCLGCVRMVKIDSNLRVPLDPFFINIEVEGQDQIKVTQRFDGSGMTYIFIFPDGEAYGKEENNTYIISGHEGATLRKEGKGFLLLQGEAYLLPSTVKSTLVESEPLLSIRLSTQVPDWAKDKIELNVLGGKYKLKSGTELWTGSKMFVYEDWMTFPTGLMINVGKGGVTLGSKSYPEGTTLTVGEDGVFLLMKKGRNKKEK